jgi:hypothetical protein
MHYGVDRLGQKHVFGNVMPDKPETLVPHEMGDVLDASRNQIIQTNNMVPQIQQPVAQMAAQESRSAGNENTHKASEEGRIITEVV